LLVLLEHKTSMFFQQDSAPAHWSRRVRYHLDLIFPGRWIGRGGPVSWCPRSWDSSSLDFFLWGFYGNITWKTLYIQKHSQQERIWWSVYLLSAIAFQEMYFYRQLTVLNVEFNYVWIIMDKKTHIWILIKIIIFSHETRFWHGSDWPDQCLIGRVSPNLALISRISLARSCLNRPNQSRFCLIT